jgi:hypothetical protein
MIIGFTEIYNCYAMKYFVLIHFVFLGFTTQTWTSPFHEGNANSIPARATEITNTIALKKYDIYAEAHGFMCPFLTPKYIQLIHSLDSCKIWKTPDLIIHVEFLKPTNINKTDLINAAVKIGYEQKLISVTEIKNNE